MYCVKTVDLMKNLVYIHNGMETIQFIYTYDKFWSNIFKEKRKVQSMEYGNKFLDF